MFCRGPSWDPTGDFRRCYGSCGPRFLPTEVLGSGTKKLNYDAQRYSWSVAGQQVSRAQEDLAYAETMHPGTCVELFLRGW